MMRALSILLALVVLVAGLPVQLACAPATFTISLKAHPEAIAADGRSETTVSADVRDASGRPVTDGTTVDFTSSIGTIERSASTMAGVARVRLKSTVQIGTAMVSAVVPYGNAVAQLSVDFLVPGTQMFGESFITVASKNHLGFDVNGRIVDSAGGVEITHRGLIITAEEAQIDLRTNILRAKCKMGVDNIVIRREGKRIEASALYYDLNSMSGILLTPAADGAKRMTIRGRDMFTEPSTQKADQAKSFDFKAVSSASVFIKAASLVIRPKEEVKIKRAAFYMDGTKMLSVPLYVVNLRSETGSASRMLTYGSDGVRLDMPFYYSLTPTSTGAFRLRRSESGGWGNYSTRPGWQLDMEQDYNVGGSTEGSFLLNRVTSANDWGARWTQRKELSSDSSVYSFLDFPSHQSLYGNMSYSRSLPAYSFSLNTRASQSFVSQTISTSVTDANGQTVVKRRSVTPPGTMATDAYIQTRAKPLLGGALNYSFTSRTSWDSRPTGEFGAGGGLQLTGRTIKLGGLGDLNTSLMTGHNWGAFGGSTMTATAGFYRSLGSSGTLGLDYTYDWGDSSGFGFSQHRLSANFSMSPSSKWSMYGYATKGLTDGSLSAFGSLSYSIARTWRCGLLGTYQKFGTFSYPDAEVSLSKAIGKQEFSLIWSSSRQRCRFEFSALKF